MNNIIAGPICSGYSCYALGFVIYAYVIGGFFFGVYLVYFGIKNTYIGFKTNKGGLAGIALISLISGLFFAGWALIAISKYVMKNWL